jgi:hypothetical protein
MGENIFRAALRGPLMEELQQSSNNQRLFNKPSPSRFFKINQTYNLMEEPDSKSFYNYESKDCTLDYLNSKKLPQDHPCVIETIRKHYLNQPSSPEVPLKLDSNDDHDRSLTSTSTFVISPNSSSHTIAPLRVSMDYQLLTCFLREVILKNSFQMRAVLALLLYTIVRWQMGCDNGGMAMEGLSALFLRTGCHISR